MWLDYYAIIISKDDKFEGLALDYPKFEFYPDCYIGIKGTSKHDIIFFNDLIEKIRKLLSLFYNQIAIIKSIYEFKKFKYRIDYNFLYKEIKNNDFFLNNFNINFGFISSILGNVIQRWLDIYDEYELIINSVCNYEEPRALSDSISKKAQLLETYGNITNKGANPREDIKTAISELKLDNLKNIFHIKSYVSIKTVYYMSLLQSTINRRYSTWKKRSKVLLL